MPRYHTLRRERWLSTRSGVQRIIYVRAAGPFRGSCLVGAGGHVTSHEQEFAEASAPRLRRAAFLLCGDWHTAEDLAQTALAKVFVSWRKVRRQDAAHAYATRTLVNSYLADKRLRRSTEIITDQLPDRPAPVLAHCVYGRRDLRVTSDLCHDVRRPGRGEMSMAVNQAGQHGQAAGVDNDVPVPGAGGRRGGLRSRRPGDAHDVLANDHDRRLSEQRAHAIEQQPASDRCPGRATHRWHFLAGRPGRPA
jgi:hypothetical protein